MNALAMTLLAAGLSGPGVERGFIGTDIEFERHVEEMTGGQDRLPMVPFEGSDYAGKLWRDVRQGHAVYHWPERRLYVIHDFFCTSDATGATMPYSCEAVAMVLRAAPPDDEGRVGEEMLAEVKGDFGAIEPHPALPIFAALRPGSCDDHGGRCDEGAMVSVHDMAGLQLCPRAAIPLLPASEGLWSELKVEDGQLRCPGGTRARVPSWAEVLRGPRAAGR